MSDSDLEAHYKEEFIARVKSARTARNLKQWQIAEALGMPQDRYKQYEGRSLLPHYLIGRFCIVCRVDPEWLLTGHGAKPLKPLELASSEEIPAKKPRRARGKKAA